MTSTNESEHWEGDKNKDVVSMALKTSRIAKSSLQLYRKLLKISFSYVALWFVNLTSDTVIGPVMGLVACMETINDPGWS